MLRLRNPFFNDRSGSVALLFALALPVLIGALAVATDMGAVYLAKRDLQAATDAAALAAVSNPDRASALVRKMLDANGFQEASFTFEIGRFVPGAVPYADERLLQAQGYDTVRIDTTYAKKTYLAPIFSIPSLKIEVRSQAALQPTVSFSSGSRLASVNPALVNGILAPLLGLQLDLSVADYTALLQSKIQLGELLKTVAGAQVGRSVGEILHEATTATVLFQKLSLQMDSNGLPLIGSILRKISQRTVRMKAGVVLGDILHVDPSLNALALDYPGQDLSAELSVLDLLNAVVGREGIGTTTTLTLPLPGIASVGVELMIGEGMQRAKSLSIGRSTPGVETDQLRLRAHIATSGALDVLNIGLDIPLEVVVAGGRAEVVSATCSADPTKRSVRLRVQPGAAKLAIGAWSGPLSSANINDKLPPVSLVSALAIKIQGQAFLAVSQVSPVELVFTGNEIEQGVVKTVRTRTIAESLVGTLLSETDITIQVGIIGLPLGGLTKSVAGLLAGLVKPLDELLQAVTAVAGIGLGEMQVRVDDIVCGQPRIVG